MFDLIIIGAGPAGLAAAIYAARAELKFIVLEKEIMSGGQIINTYEVDNYPGLYHMGGFDLAMKFREHADALGASFVTGEVERIEAIPAGKKVICKDGTEYETKTVILSGGAKHRKLEVPGEDALAGSGVSYCATCDGAFFRGKEVAVIGGGDVAVEDALFLARLCKKVYVVHRRDTFRAAKTLVTRLTEAENVELVYDSVVKEIQGKFKVESLVLENKKTAEERTIALDGVFIAVGMLPETSAYKGLVELDAAGYIVADETGITSDAAVFAAGDIRTKALRQVVTAASDGANAVQSVERYLAEVN
ncbi:MAG: thioredoxin-disulfide reductase [Lachnospiraceae bacterium]|nr:thioredoxin-disulfide reductase [Lachnospiraceae bacterium]